MSQYIISLSASRDLRAIAWVEVRLSINPERQRIKSQNLSNTVKYYRLK
ncbi:MAG: hypothetical protein PUP91_04405 [Rhizonema sp. PD37]|nr:hypothetical protein [Rhizonema sp. PD37]